MKNFDIKPGCTTFENPEASGPIELFHQFIHNTIITTDIKTRTFDYINTWDNTLISVACAIRESHNSTFVALPEQLVFDRYMIFSLPSVIDWRVIYSRKTSRSRKTTRKQESIFYDYTVGHQLFVKVEGIIQKIDTSPKRTLNNHSHVYKWHRQNTVLAMPKDV